MFSWKIYPTCKIYRKLHPGPKFTVKHGFKHRTANRQHKLVSRNHLFTFTLAIAPFSHNKLHIAEEFIVEHVLASFSDSRLCCLAVSLDHRHGSLVAIRKIFSSLGGDVSKNLRKTEYIVYGWCEKSPSGPTYTYTSDLSLACN